MQRLKKKHQRGTNDESQITDMKAEDEEEEKEEKEGKEGKEEVKRESRNCEEKGDKGEESKQDKKRKQVRKKSDLNGNEKIISGNLLQDDLEQQ